MKSSYAKSFEHALTVRPAGISDLDAIFEIERRSFDKDRFSRATLRRLLASRTTSGVIAASVDGFAGYAIVLFRAGSRVARLYSFAVDPVFRGAGVARRLLAAIEGEPRRRGCDRMRLEVRSSNIDAQRLYERAGYEAFDFRPDYYADGEAAVRMEKTLASIEEGDRRAHS